METWFHHLPIRNNGMIIGILIQLQNHWKVKLMKGECVGEIYLLIHLHHLYLILN